MVGLVRACGLFALGALCACRPAGPSFGASFRWGAASSAYQTEGGNTANDFYVFEQAGKFPQPCARAANAYELFLDDNRRVADTGLNTYRLSLEWSRLQPAPGAWDEAAAAHYRALVDDLVARGIRPVVTLHHYTNPLWVLDPRPQPSPDALGGWKDPRTAAAFEAYARLAARAFGDRVDTWLPFNEPQVYAMGAYALGGMPPGEVDTDLTHTVLPTVLPTLLEAHARAARALREEDTVDADQDGIGARVGIAHAITPVQAASSAHREAATRFDAFYNHLVPQALISGAYDEELTGSTQVNHPEWAGTLDFIGLNYYTSAKVVGAAFLAPVHAFACDESLARRMGIPLSAFGCPPADPDVERSMLGQAILPDGIRQGLETFWERYHLPLWVSEFGVATLDDDVRSRHLVRHLEAVHQAMENGVTVEGALVWSLVDNYEWGSFEPRFGLYRVDYEHDFARTATATVDVLRRTAESSALSEQDLVRFGNP